jgi:hypothetical protein
MVSSPLWLPIEPNGPFALHLRRFWPLFLTNRQEPKTSPAEQHLRGEAPKRTYHRASLRELPGCGCRPLKEYARLMPILLTNCGISCDDTAGRAFPPALILRPACPLRVTRWTRRARPALLLLCDHLGLRRNRQRPCRKSAKRHRHRGDGGLHGLGRPLGIREGARDVGLTGRARLRPIGSPGVSGSSSLGSTKLKVSTKNQLYH